MKTNNKRCSPNGFQRDIENEEIIKNLNELEKRMFFLLGEIEQLSIHKQQQEKKNEEKIEENSKEMES